MDKINTITQYDDLYKLKANTYLELRFKSHTIISKVAYRKHWSLGIPTIIVLCDNEKSLRIGMKYKIYKDDLNKCLLEGSIIILNKKMVKQLYG